MLSWFFVLIAIVGTLCVSAFKKVFIGHWLWLISTIGLVLCYINISEWPMVFLFSVYGAISAVGLFRWKSSE